jgi:hypothetical protein
LQSSPYSLYFLPPRSKHSPQHPVLRHPQSVFFLRRDSNKSIKVTFWEELRAYSFCEMLQTVQDILVCKY